MEDLVFSHRAKQGLCQRVIVHVSSDFFLLDEVIFVTLTVGEGEKLVPKSNLSKGAEGDSITIFIIVIIQSKLNSHCVE